MRITPEEQVNLYYSHNKYLVRQLAYLEGFKAVEAFDDIYAAMTVLLHDLDESPRDVVLVLAMIGIMQSGGFTTLPVPEAGGGIAGL